MQIGFTTLALGAVYRRLAQLLAADLERWAPRSRFLVLTDRPEEFRRFGNVDAVTHRQVSIFRPYHDKRFALRGDDGADVRVYLDADCRVFGPPSVAAAGGGGPAGELRANALWRLADKFEAEAKHETRGANGSRRRDAFVWENTARNRQQLVRAAAEAVGVDFERVTFVYEQCFSVPGAGDVLDAFVRTWGVLAEFLERRGLTWGEGEAIGIAAAAVGWDVRRMTDTSGWLFNDIFSRARLLEHGSLDQREAQLLDEHDSVRSQGAPASPLRRAWQRIRPLVRDPMLGPSVCYRRWSTLRIP